MKNLLFIIIFFVNIASAFSIESKIVHRIQNEIITNIDIKKEFRYLVALNNSLKELDKEKILNISNASIIREKIKKIEVMKNFKKLKVNEKYLAILMKNMYSSLGLKSVDELQSYLKEYDLTLDYIRKKIIIDGLWNELIIRKYSIQIKIDEEEIKNEIYKNKKLKSKEYQLSEIIFEVKSKEEIESKYELITKSINQIGFKNTASIYSFSQSAKTGGNIGWISKSSLSSKIQKNIENLQIGEISKPLILSNGILILKVTNIKKSKVDYEYELKKKINFEKNRQLNQFSKIYYNKIKKNLEFNE